MAKIYLILSCFLFVLHFAVSQYVFDKRSCDNMMPLLPQTTTTPGNPDGKTELPIGGDGVIEEVGEIGDDVSSLVSAATTPSSFKITTDVLKYRRNRILTVKLEGPELNGLLMQVRQFHTHESEAPTILGTFVSVPHGTQTVDCGRGPSVSVANTVVSRDTGDKRNLEFKWKAPADDEGSIQFVATVIQKQTYWSPVKSDPLLFNDFPPALSGCGKDVSCYRYTEVHENCDDGHCNYLIVSKVVDDYVVFTVGGKIQEESGYVGLGFTKDKDKMSSMDLCVCTKKDKVVDASHYVVDDASRQPVKHHEELEDEETDVDGDHIWCRFRRPLHTPGSDSIDLTQNLYQVFLWGSLDSSTGAPVLPRDDDIVRVTEAWNYTQTINVVHLVGGAAEVAGIGWLILFAVLVATVVELH